MQIFKFNNILKPVLWGGDRLVTFKGLPPCDEAIGESWELSAISNRESVVANGDDSGLTLSQLVARYGADLVGEDVYRRYGTQFPLLIKLIDARRDLSVQVHPGDEMACRRHGCVGKNEMWYILDADEGAVIHTGFNRQVTVEEFDRRLADGSLLDVVNATKSQPGEVFFIPAGQIHSIGAGNLLVEIQESSDVTYRVWDYNRRDAAGNLRQLHIDEAREALDFAPRNDLVDHEPIQSPGITPLLRCPMFEVCHLDCEDTYTFDLSQPHSFVALVCIEGAVTLHVDGMEPVALAQGETALVPAVVSRIAMRGRARLLTAGVPVVE